MGWMDVSNNNRTSEIISGFEFKELIDSDDTGEPWYSLGYEAGLEAAREELVTYFKDRE